MELTHLWGVGTQSSWAAVRPGFLSSRAENSFRLGEPGERPPGRSKNPAAASEAWVLPSLFSSHHLKILWRNGPLAVPGRWRSRGWWFEPGSGASPSAAAPRSERFSSALRHTGRPLLRRSAQFPDDAALVKAEESPGLMCQHTGLLQGAKTLIPTQKHKLRAALYSSRPGPSWRRHISANISNDDKVAAASPVH